VPALQTQSLEFKPQAPFPTPKKKIAMAMANIAKLITELFLA
jgi:hypothetical protein